MRKLKSLVLSLVAVIALAGVSYGYDNPTLDTYQIKKNAGGRASSSTRIVKLVRNSEQGQNSVAIASGDVVVYDTNSDDGVTVRLTTTSADGAIAGIAVTSIPTSDTVQNSAADGDGMRNWGWIIVHGKANAKVGAGGANGNAIGDVVITSTDSGAVTTFRDLANPTAVATAAGVNRAVTGRGGFFLDAADASSTTSEVFVNLE